MEKRKKLRLFIGVIIIIIIGITSFLTIFTIRYPLAYRNSIVPYSKEYEIDPYLVASIINVESRYDKLAMSSKEAKGLMQISPQTGQWASEVLEIENYTEEDLFDPDLNIRIGSWYINRLDKEFDGKLDLILAAYNAGSGNVNKWIVDERYSKDGVNLDIIPFKETEDYLIRVKNNYEIYSGIYKNYLFEWEKEDSYYINFLHNIRRSLEEINQKYFRGE